MNHRSCAHALEEQPFPAARDHHPPARLVQGSPDQVREVISRLLLTETRTEYLGLDDPACPSPGTRASRTLGTLVDRGVRVHQVTTRRAVEADDTPPSLRRRHGGEVRVVDRIPLTACIVDRQFALVPTDSGAAGHGTLIVTDPVVVNVLVSVHRLLWLQGHDPTAVTDGTPPHLGPVLAALASGLPDGRAAQRAGLSPRTYSRRVAELMELLGASSRFEAGVEAARRGWL